MTLLYDLLLNSQWMGKSVLMWLAFLTIIIALLLFDLGVLNRKDHTIGVRESLLLSLLYIAVAVAFGGWVWHVYGAEKGGQYFTGYLIEKTLSLDNVFVMSLIFTYLSVPSAVQHRVLFWGILGALILRGLMIAAGVALIHQFEWVLYLFGAFLVATGVKMLFDVDDQPDISKNPLLRILQRFIPITHRFDGHRFFMRLLDETTGRMRRYATPLFVALVLVETADIVFAVDSVPAIFAITTDPYIIYTSNIFAVLGLRALYFALAAIVYRFQYMKYALSIILVFIGLKIFATDLLGWKIPSAVSLGVTVALILGGVLVSLWFTRRDTPPDAGDDSDHWGRVKHRDKAYAVRVSNDDK